jgi:tetratricopeptide (TPR) repeat protein
MSGEGTKLSRHELKEDEFVESVMRAVDYVRAHLQYFIGGLIALAALLMVVNYVRSSQEQARLDAVGLLGDAFIAEDTGQAGEAISLSEKLISDYDGTPAAGQGMLVLANRYFAQENYDQAQRLYEKYLDENGKSAPLAFAAWHGIASCLDAQGRTKEALSKYQEYAEVHPGTAEAAISLMAASRCYGRLGDKGAQKELLEKIVRNYPELPVADQAKAMKEML